MTVAPNTYSFTSIQGTISGPGGTISLGNSAGPAPEGITIEFTKDINTMTQGADGSVMHALHAERPGKLTARYLKTSPTNGALSALWNFQQSSPANWGTNVIEFIDVLRGDVITLTQGAFTRPPTIVYNVEGPMNEWTFEGYLSQTLGTGVANVNTSTGV